MDRVLTGANPRRNLCRSGCKKQSGTRRFRSKRFKVAGAPKVVDDDQGGLLTDRVPVLILTAEFRVIAAQVIIQALRNLFHLRDEVVSILFARSDPDNPIGK